MAKPGFGGPVPPGNDVYKTKGKKKKKKPPQQTNVLGGGPLTGLGVGRLAEAVEKQAATQKSIVESQMQGPLFGQQSPIDKLMSDFMSQYQSINVPSTPLEQLQRMAEQQVGAQFDPMIQMLQSQMTQKQNRGKRSQGEARAMYGDLGKSFLAEIPEMTQQFAQEDRETNQRYDSAQAELQKMYGDQSKQQQAVLQNLGIQAAAPEASQQARDDQKYFHGQMELQQQGDVGAMNEQQRAAQTYQQNLGDTSRMAGENTAQDIGRMLEDYLDQANTQMGGLQAQRGSALSTLLQQMQSQDAERVQEQEQQQFQNLMALSRFQLDAAKASAAENEAQDPLFKGTSGLSGAQNFLGQQYNNQPIMAQGLMEQLNDVLANPDVVRGKFQLSPGDPALGKGPTYSDVGQEFMMDLLRKEIEGANQESPGRYGSGDINNAINALLAYMGKLR